MGDSQMNAFDFTALENEDFKEDSVREFIITPFLQELGFVLKDSKQSQKNSKLEMALSLKLTSPTITGSNEKITFTRFPDYVLYVDSKPHCVLDAKAPKVEISAQSKAKRQAFYYAINPELKAPFYALCNGKSFTLFETNGQNLLKEFSCEELFAKDCNNEFFASLKQYLSIPLESLRQSLTLDSKTLKKPDSWYLSRELPKAITNPKKQAKARYFGCTAYFTRQSWDIVEQNIKNFTDKGDVVLDSFGGSGVTAIEAMMQGRIAIHTDLSPLSIFMTKALSVKVDLSALLDLSEAILSEFESIKPKNEKEARQILKNAKYYPNALDGEFGEVATQKSQDSTLWIPQDEILPKGSDMDSVLGLFSKMQLAELTLLRKLIFKHTTPSGSKESRIRKRNLRYSLMLAFYNTLSLINLTYHTTPKGGGNYFAFYYRYRNLNVIWNNLIKKAVEGHYIDRIADKFENFIPAINERFECDKKGKYHLRENASFSNFKIPLEKRAEYLIRGILGRAKEINRGVTIKELALRIIPLSSNGVQTNNKLIKEILNEIATADKDTGEWRLKHKKGTQGSLFDD